MDKVELDLMIPRIRDLRVWTEMKHRLDLIVYHKLSYIQAQK
jgi:hypothetical protein